MSIDKISGKSDNIGPERKGEKKLRDDVGSKFKEVEKTGAVDPDNRRRRREPSDSLAELSNSKKDLNQTPQVDRNDNRGPLQVPTSAKSFQESPSNNYVPSSNNAEEPVYDEVTYGPNESKQPAETAAYKEKALKAKLAASMQKLDAKPVEKIQGQRAKTSEKTITAPLEKHAAPIRSVTKKQTPHHAARKAEETPPTKPEVKVIKKEAVPAKTKEEQKKDRQETPIKQGEVTEAHAMSAQPTIIIGAAAPSAPPPSHVASSQLSHPEVARLFDQMVSHITAIASKGVKAVTITLSSGTFRGSQIIIRETSTALRNYNIELRGLTPQAQKLFEEHIGSLMQLFSTQKYPFTIHRLETRHLIERKEQPGQEQEEEEPEK